MVESFDARIEMSLNQAAKDWLFNIQAAFSPPHLAFSAVEVAGVAEVVEGFWRLTSLTKALNGYNGPLKSMSYLTRYLVLG